MTHADPRLFIRTMFQAYAEACAVGCVYELKLRLLAENRPETRPHAYERDLKNVEEPIIAAYRSLLPDGEAQKLRDTRVLRNKVLHCEFDVAHQKLEDLGKPIAPGLVAGGKFDTGETYLVGDRTTQGAGIYGWLMASHLGGLFPQARDAFAEAIGIVDRILTVINTPPAEKNNND